MSEPKPVFRQPWWEKMSEGEPVFHHWRNGKPTGKITDRKGKLSCFSEEEIEVAMKEAMKITRKNDKRKFPKETLRKLKVSKFQQPFYCHWQNGKWDGYFRDAEGNIIE